MVNVIERVEEDIKNRLQRFNAKIQHGGGYVCDTDMGAIIEEVYQATEPLRTENVKINFGIKYDFEKQEIVVTWTPPAENDALN